MGVPGSFFFSFCWSEGGKHVKILWPDYEFVLVRGGPECLSRH